jgi:hypothetical protein
MGFVNLALHHAHSVEMKLRDAQLAIKMMLKNITTSLVAMKNVQKAQF